MMILRLLVGLGVLAMGRQLFWLFVGAVGFVLGLSWGPKLFADQPDWAVLALALGLGVVGAVLAVMLQKVAVGLAGFVAGGFVLARLANLIGLAAILEFDDQTMTWITFVIGGVIGAIFVLAIFDWALIILSTLFGGGLIVETLDQGPLLSVILFLVLVIIGVIIQAKTMQQRGTSGRSTIKRPSSR